MSFLADLTVELGAEIKKPYPKRNFSHLFAFLTKKIFLAILHNLFTDETTKRDLEIVDGAGSKNVTNEKFSSQ